MLLDGYVNTTLKRDSRLTRSIANCTVFVGYNENSKFWFELIVIAIMPIHVPYATAHANLAKLCDEVTEKRRVIVIRRPGGKNVALISADELASLQETSHLLGTQKNAERLLAALNRVKAQNLNAHHYNSR